MAFRHRDVKEFTPAEKRTMCWCVSGFVILAIVVNVIEWLV